VTDGLRAQEIVVKKWLRRIRGAVGMGLTWAVVWGAAAVLIGLLVDPDGSMDEMWVAIGAYPGFLGGVVFSAVLAIAARRRRLDELSLSRVAAWGAGAGLLVGAIPFVLGDPNTEMPVWLLAGVVIGSITLLSAASAAGSLALARTGERRALRRAGADVPGPRAGVDSHRTLIDRQGRDNVAGVEARVADPVARGS
jgi:peptidoglycan/LPS O-acetylase OafA/YrhL